MEKSRIPAQALMDIYSAVSDPDHVFQEIPLIGDIALAMRSIPREQIPDMPDRIVAATAVSLNVPILSRDGRIQRAIAQTIW